jgi:hypothetical protein
MLMPKLATFLPNDANRRLFPGFLALCVAASGAALELIAWSLSVRWLSIVAVVVTIAGIVGVFFFIVHGWFRVISQARARSGNGRNEP